MIRTSRKLIVDTKGLSSCSPLDKGSAAAVAMSFEPPSYNSILTLDPQYKKNRVVCRAMIAVQIFRSVGSYMH